MREINTVLFRVDGSVVESRVPRPANYNEIVAIVAPGLDTEWIERVAVLYKRRPADMFVGDTSAKNGLPRNERATEIYRTYAMSRFGGLPESLPAIYGPAFLFEGLVWL